MGAAGPAGRGRAGRPRLCLGARQRGARTLLRRRRPQHVDQLAQLLLRRLRSRRYRHGRQAPGGAVVAGPVAARLRDQHLGHRHAPGGRRHPHRSRPLPGRPATGRPSRRHRRRAGPGRQSRHRSAQPREHLRLPAHPPARPGRRRHRPGAHHGPAPVAGPGRRLGGPRLPGQDDPGLVGPAGVVARLPHRLPGARDGASSTSWRRRW